MAIDNDDNYEQENQRPQSNNIVHLRKDDFSNTSSLPSSQELTQKITGKRPKTVKSNAKNRHQNLISLHRMRTMPDLQSTMSHTAANEGLNSSRENPVENKRENSISNMMRNYSDSSQKVLENIHSSSFPSSSSSISSFAAIAQPSTLPQKSRNSFQSTEKRYEELESNHGLMNHREKNRPHTAYVSASSYSLPVINNRPSTATDNHGKWSINSANKTIQHSTSSNDAISTVKRRSYGQNVFGADHVGIAAEAIKNFDPDRNVYASPFDHVNQVISSVDYKDIETVDNELNDNDFKVFDSQLNEKIASLEDELEYYIKASDTRSMRVENILSNDSFEELLNLENIKTDYFRDAAVDSSVELLKELENQALQQLEFHNVNMLLVSQRTPQDILKQRIDAEIAQIENERFEHAQYLAMEKQLAMYEASASDLLLAERMESDRLLAEKELFLLREQHQKLKNEQENFRRMEDLMIRRIASLNGNVIIETNCDSNIKDRNSKHEDKDFYKKISSRQYSVGYMKQPRLIRLRFDVIRALKNKVPRGNFVMMATLYSRLGGEPMRFEHSTVRYTVTGATPIAQYHDARFYNLELNFAQPNNRVFLAVPSQTQSMPSMILLFELWYIGTSTGIIASNNGKYDQRHKVVGWGAFPLLNGDLELNEGRFKTPLLRGTYNSGIDMFKTIEQSIVDDVDNWLGNVYFDMRNWKYIIDNDVQEKVDLTYTGTISHSNHEIRNALSSNEQIASSHSLNHSPISNAASEYFSDDLSPSNESSLNSQEHVLAQDDSFQLCTFGNRILHVQLRSFQHKTLFREAPDENMFEPTDDNQQRLQLLDKYTPLVYGNRRLLFGSQLAGYKIQYLKSMLKEEFAPGWKHPIIYYLPVVLIVCLWLRLYVHYVAQALYLRTIGVPIESSSNKFYTVQLIYADRPENINVMTLVGAIIVGPASCLVVYALALAVVALGQRIVNNSHAAISSILLCWGIACSLDPLLILIVDACVSDWNGDAFKLYNFMQTSQHTGVAGIMATIVLYALDMAIGFAIVYHHLLYVHSNGRFLDMHNRLYAHSIYLPNDLEMSARALSFVLNSSKIYMGASGERHKITTHSFQIGAHIFKHVAIFVLHMNGDVELHRHFLCDPNGMITELFEPAPFQDDDDVLELFDSATERIAVHAITNTTSELHEQQQFTSSTSTPVLQSRTKFSIDSYRPQDVQSTLNELLSDIIQER